MIDLGKAPMHALGVTIFPDHADPAQFHFLPDSPRLHIRDDGTPELSLVEYQLDPALQQALGAGLLSFTVDLSVAEDVQQQLRGKIAHQFAPGQPIQLSPVTVENGSCDVVVIDKPSDTGLVQRILGDGTPSLYGDQVCTFTVVLDADGASLVAKALGAGGLPVGVVYRLTVLGLRPALRARITARWQDIYHYYDNRLHGGKLLLAVDIGTTVEDLIHAEAITIVVDQLVPPDQQNPVYQGALDQVQRYVLEQFFKPTLGQQPPSADDSTGSLATIGNAIKDFAGFFSLTYSLVDVNRDELKEMTYELAVAQAEKLTFAPQATFSLLLATTGKQGPPIDVSKLIKQIPLAASDNMDFVVTSVVDLNAEQIDHVDVMLAYGPNQRELILDAKTPRQTASFFREENLGQSITSRYEITFLPGAGLSGSLASSPVTSANRVLCINPLELYQRISVVAVAIGVPFDRYPQVIVDVQVPDLAAGTVTTQTLRLDGAHMELGFVVRASLGLSLPIQRRIRYVDAHGVEYTVDWELAKAGFLIIGDPFPNVLTVQIIASARFGSVVSRLVTELRSKAHPEQVTTAILTAAQPSATWTLALADSADLSYEYRVTMQTVRGEVRQGQWLANQGATLIVGEGIARLRQVTMLFVGRSLGDLGLLGVKLRFSYDDDASNLHAEDEMMVRDATQSVEWSYPIADLTKQAYSYQVSLVHADGRIEARDPATTTDLLVIVTLT